jgi:hypothetical protein
MSQVAIDLLLAYCQGVDEDKCAVGDADDTFKLTTHVVWYNSKLHASKWSNAYICDNN